MTAAAGSGSLSSRIRQPRAPGACRRVNRRPVRCTAQLTAKKCMPCEPDEQALQYMGLCGALSAAEEQDLLAQLQGWQVSKVDGHDRLQKSFRCKNFLKALDLCGRVADVAEAEGHHPDIHLTNWNHLELSLWTHARQGLTENDFIVAAKLDELAIDDVLSKRHRSS